MSRITRCAANALAFAMIFSWVSVSREALARRAEPAVRHLTIIAAAHESAIASRAVFMLAVIGLRCGVTL